MSNNEPKRKGFFGRVFGSGDAPPEPQPDVPASETAATTPEAAPGATAAPPARTGWFDRLKSGLESGGKVRVTIPKPGSYDVRAVDRDGREQHVANLRLAAGGRYVLELEEGGWRAPR